MIELRSVRKVFDNPRGEPIVAVDDVNLVVNTGETVCLIGPSGCGKTTTMKLVNRLLEPTSGEILVGGENVAHQDVISLRRRIGYVIQRGGLFPHMTVARNVSLLCELEHWPRDKTHARVEELLHLVNLPPEEFAHRYPNELSGGQRQRVGVARALVLNPDYILMDEPFGALDPITREQIHQEFSQLKQRVQKTIILVTHDLAEAFQLGDRVALMFQGNILQLGTETEFREHPANSFVHQFIRKHLDTSDLTDSAPPDERIMDSPPGIPNR